LLIASPFFPVGRSGRDDSDDLDRLSVLLVIQDRMGNHEEQIPLHDPQRLPTLFTTFNANLLGERERIGEHPQGDIEANRVLAQIDGRLGEVLPKPR
jgi:hypothetical protein